MTPVEFMGWAMAAVMTACWLYGLHAQNYWKRSSDRWESIAQRWERTSNKWEEIANRHI